MRYSELFEATSAESIVTAIKANCSDIVNMYKQTNVDPRSLNGFLLRGVENKPAIFKSESHQNRTPKDSIVELQNLVDDWLHYNGFKALRSNSIFCVGTWSHARTYGPTYIIFPVNGFDYTWFKGTYDLFVHFSAVLSKEIDKIAQKNNMNFKEIAQLTAQYPKEKEIEIYKNNLDEIMLKADPVQDNLELCLASYPTHEVMITGKYYAISVTNTKVLQQILK